MIRKLTAAGVILIVGGLVVAMLPAQETDRTGEISVLRTNDARRSVSDRVGNGLSNAAADASSRPKLVDRLQKIRRKVMGDGSTTLSDTPNTAAVPETRRGGTISGPVDLDPAKQQPVATEMNGEPNLLPAQTAPGSDPETTIGDRSPRFQQSPAPFTRITDGSNSARRPRTSRQPIDLSPPAATTPAATTPAATTPSIPAAPERSATEAVVRPLRESVQSTPPTQQRIAKRPSPAFEAPASPGTLLSTKGASLRVDTTGPHAILVGREAKYSLKLMNQSSIPASDVFVRINVPAWIDVGSADASLGTTQVRGDERGNQHLIWNANQLAAGGTETLHLKLVPRENRPFHLAVDWTQRPAASVAEIEVQQPQLEMAVFGPREIQFGETAVYTIQLANPGTGPADGVSVDFGYGDENLPTKEIGTLAAGEQTEIRVELTARQAGVLQVGASATASGGLHSETKEDVLVRRAKLEVEVIGVPVKFAGSVATYEIRVRNVGDAAATEVETNVALPSGAKYLSRDRDLVLDNNTLKRRLGTITPGSERSFRFACQLMEAGDNLLEARSVGQAELMAVDTFVTQVRALADLKLTVNDPKGPIPINTDTVYELTIVNRGTKTARDVRIVGQFSEGIEPVEAAGTMARTVPGQVLFNPISRIDPGEEVQLKIVARADRDGTHRFRAEVKCSEPETILVAEESTYFFGDDLSTANGRKKMMN